MTDAPALNVQLVTRDQIARIDKGRDYGSQAGALTLDSTVGTHVLDASGDLVITLPTTVPDWAFFTVLCLSGGTSVTVEGIDSWPLGVPSNEDMFVLNFQRVRGQWLGFPASGGGTVDTTPPTTPTLSIVSTTQSSVTLAIAGSTDDIKVTRARWSTDGGTTWTTAPLPSGSGNITASGLAGATPYTFTVQTGDAANNWSPSATVAASTKTAPYADTVLTHSPSIYLPFNDAAGSTTATNLGTNGGTVAVTGFSFGAPGIGDKDTCATMGAQSSTQFATNCNSGGTWELIFKVASAPGQNVDFLKFGGGIARMYPDGSVATYFGGQFLGQGGNGYPVSMGKAHHFAFTYAPDGTQRYYLDGALVGNATGTMSVSDTILSLLPGNVAGFAFTPSVLSAEQVKADARSAGVGS